MSFNCFKKVTGGHLIDHSIGDLKSDLHMNHSKWQKYGLSLKKDVDYDAAIANTFEVSDKIKSVREEQKLAADKAKAYFESYTSVGGGLTLTLKQLKELKERVKTDMPETLEILNNIDSSKINDWASNLKAQMIASGKTVE